MPQDLSFMDVGQESDLSFMEAGSDVPSVEVMPSAEHRPVRGFWDTIEDPVTLMKNDSIVANAVKYFTTPTAEYEAKEARAEKENKHTAITSVPAMNDLVGKLDQFEAKAKAEGLTSQEEEVYFQLQNAYGTMYDSLSAAYEKGDLTPEFSFEAIKQAAMDDPGGTVAEFANALMADPEFLLVPVGWELAAAKAAESTAALGRAVQATAKTAAGISGAATTGASIAVADEATRQLAENNRLDYESLKNIAAVGAVAGPTIVGAAKGVKALNKLRIEKSNIKQANTIIEKFENTIGDYRSKGLNEKEAIRQASIDLGVNHSAMKAYSVTAGRPVRFDLDKVTPQYEKKLSTKMSRMYEDSFIQKTAQAAQEFIDNYITPESTVIGRYSQRLMHKVRRFEHESMKMALDAREVIKPFIKSYRDLSKEQRAEVDYQLYFNGGIPAAKEYLSSIGKTDLLGELDRVKVLYDNFYQEQVAVGHKPDYVEGYFHREMVDYKGFRQATGRPATEDPIDIEIRKAAQKKGSDLTSTERSLIIDKIMRKGTYVGPEFGLGSVKKRKVQGGRREWLKYYASAEESLERYIQQVTHNIHRRRFFGYGATDDAAADLDVVESVGNILDREILAGNLTLEGKNRIKPLIAARFGAGERSPHKYMQDVKNVLYMATLGNPLSAATQLGDLGIAGYAHGMMNTAKGLLKPNQIRLADTGIDMAAAEFESTRGSARVLNKILKGVGFKAIDELGKTANIQAAMKKLQTWARPNNQKGMLKLRDKYAAAFTDREMGDFIEALRTNNMRSPLIKYAAFNELANLQPIALSEMPLKYLQNPNGRIMYMLKSFTIKQLDIMRRDAFAKIKQGGSKNVTNGMANLTRFTMMFTAANMSSDMVKEFLTTGEVNLDDVDDRIIPNLYRNFGLSEYIINKYEDQPFMAATQIAVPPINIADDAYGDLANLGQQFNSLRYVPIAGRMMYEWFGGGYEKRMEKEMTEALYPKELKELYGEDIEKFGHSFE